MMSSARTRPSTDEVSGDTSGSSGRACCKIRDWASATASIANLLRGRRRRIVARAPPRGLGRCAISLGLRLARLEFLDEALRVVLKRIAAARTADVVRL